MNLKNDHVNEKILAALGKVPIRAGAIVETTKIDSRGVDRGLQRLRKAGKIKLVTGPGGGWVLK
jgi:DNA-binding IscR family transcriptional regulator